MEVVEGVGVVWIGEWLDFGCRACEHGDEELFVFSMLALSYDGDASALSNVAWDPVRSLVQISS
jgi:hypothetical protein